jgi:hypothetical protein
MALPPFTSRSAPAPLYAAPLRSLATSKNETRPPRQELGGRAPDLIGSSRLIQRPAEEMTGKKLPSSGHIDLPRPAHKNGRSVPTTDFTRAEDVAQSLRFDFAR